MANNLRSGRVPPGSNPANNAFFSFSFSSRLLLLLHHPPPPLPPFFLFFSPLSFSPPSIFLLSQPFFAPFVRVFVGVHPISPRACSYSANNDREEPIPSNGIGHLARSDTSATIAVGSRVGSWSPFLSSLAFSRPRVDTYRPVDNFVSEIPDRRNRKV